VEDRSSQEFRPQFFLDWISEGLNTWGGSGMRN
jgi:hypothetical protein